MKQLHLLLLFVFTSVFFLHAQTIVNVIPLPNETYWNQAYGIAADSNYLYISSSTSTTSAPNYGYIYKIDYAGNIVGDINPARGASQGLVFNGEFYFYVRRYTSTCTIFKLYPDGSLVDSMRITNPQRYIGGITFDGTDIWVSDYYPTDGRLYKINWDTKAIVDSISTLGAQPTGVAYDDSYLYYAMDRFSSEPNFNLIYVVDPVSHDTVRTIQMPDNNPLGDVNPRGLAIFGRYMWLIAKPLGSPSGQAIYQYDLGGNGTPSIALSAKVFNIGNVAVGSSGNAVCTIQNTGSGDLILDSVGVMFSQNFSTNLTPPYTITPNNSVAFTITFTPQSFGKDSAYFILYSNDIVRGPQTVKTYGNGISASGFISVPDSFDYNTRRINSTTKWNLKIQNLANEELYVDSAALLSFTGGFYLQSGTFPVTVPPLSSLNVRVWFQPHSVGTHAAVLRLFNNSTNAPEADISLSGIGEQQNIALGVPLWKHTVADHPISNSGRLVKAVRAINDITEDGKKDIIVSTENYWTMALNGNGSGTTDSLWAFTSYISNYSAGSIGTVGDYSHQKALEIASDLNGDGFNDVVIGTGGGNEHVYAIDGKKGTMLWTYGTDAQDSFSLGDFTAVDVKRDFNNDDVPDVVAIASATETGGIGGRRMAYLFNGINGEIIWTAPMLGFTHGIISTGDLNNDGTPDVVATVGEPSFKATAFSGTNGVQIWNFPVPSGGSAKEVIEFPVPGITSDIILGAFWGPIYRLNGATGMQKWSRPTGNSGVMQLAILKDVTGDGVDEVLAVLLGNGTYCINGENGDIVWSLATSNTMGITAVSDLNSDGIDEVAIAVQNTGAKIVRGNNGEQLALYTTTTTEQTREIAIVPDMDNNNSFEIIFGGKIGNIVLLSGGPDAPAGISSGGQSLPKEFSLSNNYPNPFNPTTTFHINLPQMVNVEISIYNILGQKIRGISYENMAAGVNEITWNGKNDNRETATSGVYIARVRAFNNTKELYSSHLKMVLMK